MTRQEPPRGLRETQEWLARCVLDATALESAASAGVLGTPPGGDVHPRLHAYADGYPARIREALIESFPGVMHLIGEHPATALTLRYIAAHPPTGFNLNHAGNALPDFLRTDALSLSFPFLPDLAAFEWQMMQAFHAESLPPLDSASLADIAEDAWATARLRFQPAVAVVSSEWPLRDLHAARDTPLDDIDIDLNDRPEHLLIRRHDLAVHCDPIDAVEANALRSLIDGTSLGDVMQQLADANQDPDQISAWFTRWMQLGLIVSIELEARTAR